MAIVKMSRLDIAVVHSQREKVLSILQSLACVHMDALDKAPTGLDPVPDEGQEISRELFDLENAIRFVERHAPEVKISFVEKLAATLPQISLRDRVSVYERWHLPSLLSELNSLEKDITATNALVEQQQALLHMVERWEPCGVDFNLVNGESSFVFALTGYTPLALKGSFLDAMALVEDVEISHAFDTVNESFFYVAGVKSGAAESVAALREAGFSEVRVTSQQGSTDSIITAIKDELSRLQLRQRTLHVCVENSVELLPALRQSYDHLYAEQAKQKALSRGYQTESVSFYQTWVPSEKERGVAEILSRQDGVSFELSAPTPEEFENVPVALHNQLAAPYEGLSLMYGTPLYGQTLDPTPHLAPFYWVFYGFALGDLLYGSLLALGGAWAAYVSRRVPSRSRFLSMLAWGGVSSMFFGIVFGSFAGNLFSVHMPFAPFDKMGLLDALSQPMFVLWLTLCLGAVQLLYGVILKLVIQARESVYESLCNQVPWLVFLLGFFGFLVMIWIGGMARETMPSVPELSSAQEQVVYLCLMVGTGLILLNAARRGMKTGLKGVVVGFLAGLWELYGASGFLGDLLSYARLLALGLSSGVIANVFNDLVFSMLIKPLPSAIGVPVGIVLLVALHLFNMILGAFGAFVHALRLQFVEFFSKFLLAGGKDYAPLSLAGEYYALSAQE